MSDVIISPNMSLPVPVVGQDPGPDWANNINASLGILDQHNHSPGQGVQITSAGIDINIDLTMQGNNLTNVNTVRLLPLAMSLPGLAPNLGCLYVAGNELYYNDESGNVVEITKTGSVNAGAGSITGLPSGTASASYSSISQTFVFQSATSTPANIDGGSFIFRDISASSNGVTVSAPASLAANYQIFWPAAIAAANNSLLTENTSGAMSYTTVDNSSLQISGGVLSVKSGGVPLSSLFTRTTGTTVGVGGVAVSNPITAGPFTGNNTITGFNVTITTTGRPVSLSLSPTPGSTTGSYITFSGTTSVGKLEFANGGIAVSASNIITTGINLPSSSFSCLDMSVLGSPGTYTYNIATGTGAGSISFVDCVLVAYEIA